ncbi:MAG TPA: glycosyl transferase, partial [Sphingobacteriaceae bacterium]|nr:glycosyl transferase [Sphingobacteriaceae bacterium]
IQDQTNFLEKIEPHLNDDIRFIGHAGPEKRNELLSKAYALLHPINFNEPFGMSVAESMLCGTPVIAFNKGSMQELIRNEETGFLVNNIDEAVEAVDLIKNIQRRNCHDWSKSMFSQEKMIEDYLKAYNQII